MKFEQVRSRLKKYQSVKKSPQIKQSLINQARLCEGKEAAGQLSEEFSGITNKNKFGGFGHGRKLGEGIWAYDIEKNCWRER